MNSSLMDAKIAGFGKAGGTEIAFKFSWISAVDFLAVLLESGLGFEKKTAF